MSADDDYDDYDDWIDDGCYECGGEGFVSDCVEEWACVDPDYGCDYCTRPCPLCSPPKRNPDLDAVLSEALANAVCPVCSGDCGSANPPVMFCPMRDTTQGTEARQGGDGEAGSVHDGPVA